MDPYKPGQVILQNQPFAYTTLSTQRKHTCEACFRFSPQRSLDPCPQCSTVYYCSGTCFESEGLVANCHKTSGECHLMTNLGGWAHHLDDNVLLVLRTFLCNQTNPQVTDAIMTTPKRIRGFSDLMDHSSEIQRDSSKLLMEYWNQLKMVLSSGNLRMPIWADFVSIYGKLLTNSYTVVSEEAGLPIGKALYLGGSFFDHSCVPNAYPTFEGKTLKLVVHQFVTPLPDLANVNISYVDTNLDERRRNLELRTIWYFRCECSKCQNERLD